MAPGRTSLKIISERPGPGTGDRYYQTEDGRWWRDVQYGDRQGTGDSLGEKRDGRIYDEGGF